MLSRPYFVLKCYLIACLTLIATTGNAQLNIKGSVIGPSNEALIHVGIKIIYPNNKIKLLQTNSLGNFQILNLDQGRYNLIFSTVGFAKSSKEIVLNQDTFINVQLIESATNLNDVKVSAKKLLIERKLDRTVFNIENSITVIGTDALETLAKVPGLKVLNDKISLVGKGAVNIMINGRLIPLSGDDLSNYLRSISSSSLAKIEVITNPPAQYDAQGNNGLINIILKQNKELGFNGSVNAGFNQASYATFYTGTTFTYRKDALAIYTNLNFRKGSLVPFEQSYIFYPTQTWDILNKDRNFRTVPSGQLGLDYQFSKKTTIGLLYGEGYTDFHSIERIETKVFNNAGRLDSALNSDAKAKIKSYYQALNLYFKQKLDSTGKQLILNADWFGFNDNKQRNFNNAGYLEQGIQIPNSFNDYLSASKQKINLYTLKADVDLPYSIFNLSFGAKLSFIRNGSDVAFYKSINNHLKLDETQSNLFNYQENTQAMYLSLNRALKKWDFQFGLRAEYTQVKGISYISSNQSDYFKLFPTVFINYKPTSDHVFSFNYGRRINRPAYKKLNPFRWHSNPYIYMEGNPDLQPSYSNNIEIAHTYAGVFTSKLSVSTTANGYNDVNFVEHNSNVQISKPVNFIQGSQYQISNSFTFNQIKWLESISQLDLYYSVFKSKIPETISQQKGYGAYFSMVNQFVLNRGKTFMADASFWYQFPAIDGLNKNKSQSNLDMGIKAILLDKKLQMAIAFTDVLKTNKYQFQSIISSIQQDYNNYYDSRQLRISARYSFGNSKIKGQNRRAGNEEERRRSN